MDKNILSMSDRLQLLNTDANSILATGIDLPWLYEQANLPFIIQTLPAHALYTILQKNDLQDNLELIEWIRGPQLQKILDFDIWHRNNELQTDDISYGSALAWIQSWLAIGPEFTADRFFELEEETSLLILNKLFIILPEGIAHITDDVRENWAATPDKRFFIKHQSDENTDFEILTEFIRALYGRSIKEAGELFSAASMLVRQETLEFAQKWRSARLADQGFVSSEEAYQVLFGSQIKPQSFTAYQNTTKGNFTAEDAVENVQYLLKHLEPEDGLHILKQALNSENIKKITGTVNASIDHLYDDDEFIEDSANEIAYQTQKILYAINTSFKKESKESLLLVESILKQFYESDPDLMIIVKQKLAYLTNVTASVLGASTAYQSSVVQTAMCLVRGALNVGFEICLEDLLSSKQTTSLYSPQVLDSGVRSLKEFGIDTIFKIGFNSIIDLQKTLLNSLVEHKYTSVKTRAAARAWVNSSHFSYSTESHLALEGLLRTIPMVHQEIFALESLTNKMPTYISQKYKPFEFRAELKQVEMFIQNLTLNLK